ncbi:hypothetical protein B0H13DRAFT_2465746 [Mycena leptocephala]|nr:hypothetical protein B0H13DRAFT_2465746 [Mycena leptocephala]
MATRAVRPTKRFSLRGMHILHLLSASDLVVVTSRARTCCLALIFLVDLRAFVRLERVATARGSKRVPSTGTGRSRATTACDGTPLCNFYKPRGIRTSRGQRAPSFFSGANARHAILGVRSPLKPPEGSGACARFTFTFGAGHACAVHSAPHHIDPQLPVFLVSYYRWSFHPATLPPLSSPLRLLHPSTSPSSLFIASRRSTPSSIFRAGLNPNSYAILPRACSGVRPSFAESETRNAPAGRTTHDPRRG